MAEATAIDDARAVHPAHAVLQRETARQHAVQFYDSDAELAAAVVPYLLAGAREGDALIVIAEDAHRGEFEAGLADAGVDVAQARAAGTFVSLDAASTLAQLMPAGELDADAFEEVIGGTLRKAARGASGIRAYGEMVALLWEAGDVTGAIELERLWNELAREVEFSLFCAYPSASVEQDRWRDALHEVCELHSLVVASAASAARASRAERVQLALELDSCARARLFVRSNLRRWGYSDSTVDAAGIVATELATNAVVHARSAFALELLADGDAVRIAVTDRAPAPAVAWTVRLRHGLSIVTTVCERWGVSARRDGKTVWAELSAAA